MITPHNNANLGDIAETVLFPGDPLRAKFIAENFLEGAVQVNSVRNMFAYTGTYKGKRVTVMGSGMGVPSLAIYAEELYSVYNVKRIIRVGTAGGMQENVKIRDLIIVQGASSDSNFAYQFNIPGTIASLSSYNLLERAVTLAKEFKVPYHVGNIFTSDIFYNHYPEVSKKWTDMGILGVDMESYGLFLIAAKHKREALTILTVSDSLITHEKTTPEERQEGFKDMMNIALNL